MAEGDRFLEDSDSGPADGYCIMLAFSDPVLSRYALPHPHQH